MSEEETVRYVLTAVTYYKMPTFRNCYHSHTIIVDPSAAQLHAAAAALAAASSQLLLARPCQLLPLLALRAEAEEPVAKDLDQLAEDSCAADLQELQQGGRDDAHLCVPVNIMIKTLGRLQDSWAPRKVLRVRI